MLQPTYPGSPRHSTSTHPDIEFGREQAPIGGQEGIGPTDVQSRSNTCRVGPQMRPCEGVAVNVPIGGDGDIERVMEIPTLIYQQPWSPLEKNKRIFSQLVGQAVSGSVFSKSPIPRPSTQIQVREVYFPLGKPLISTVFLGVIDVAVKTFNA